LVMPLLLRDAGLPEAPPVARATGSFPTGGSIDRAMRQSRDTVQLVCAGGRGDARSRGAAGSGPVEGDGDCARERHSGKQTLPIPEPIEQGIRDLVHQCREFLIILWLSPGRRSLALLIIGMVLVICLTAAAQVGLNAWNRPFYEAIAERKLPAFLDQLLVFAVIAGCLLVLNVAQAWLREMIKLNAREWLPAISSVNG
jgi:ABC transporter transmembrane region 2